ncbi:cathepsin L1-like [Elysia marginata]|uniref:Cathepsin L1-like n=1 Tax=Elysia marginata TaxID=1093978 RepID=A0AAV4ETE2_9GAST|nr:cathepsin L1-like [Elysia marginata]
MTGNKTNSRYFESQLRAKNTSFGPPKDCPQILRPQKYFKMLKFAIAVALLALSVSARLDLDDYWMSYKVLHGKNYITVDEDARRRSIWEENLAYIQRHNIEADRGMHTFTLGESQFTDMTNEEFRQTMNGYIMSERSSSVQFVPTSMDPPSSVDWRTKGYVTKVKNQVGPCI